MDTPCRNSQHLNKTNYMRMEYECIPSRVIADQTDNVLITDNAVHIRNPKYPDGNTFQPGTAMTCFVEASPQTPIVVTAIFLKFLQLHVASGVCGQRVTIEDGTDYKEISCESNNNYHITDVYTSSSHYIKFKVFSNSLSNREWRYWFQFKGVEPNSRISLTCGSPGETTVMSSTPLLSTTATPATAQGPGRQTTTQPPPPTLLIAISVTLAVILIIMTVVTILCCKKKIADKCGCGKGAIYPLLSEIGFEGDGVDTEKSGLHIELEIERSEEKKEAKRKELKRRKKEKNEKKEKKRKKRESELRFLAKQQRMNDINRFRVAGYAASAFRPPVMRPYYSGSGQENYYIPGQNMYDQQLPLTGSIYGYPAGQNLNFQNAPPAGVQSSSTSLSTDGNYKNAYVTPTSLRRHPPAMSVSQTASEGPLIFHTGQFGSQFVPQGSIYEPYENPALRQWRVAGMAATFASHPRAGRHSVEIGSVDNPSESESSQSYDDSIV
ncbi:hypothetical protein CHS0354_016045 [Potamilus streckersoni]|nr:hypothetical protein CHS0354_016045 [Potamilus streckersoni]